MTLNRHLFGALVLAFAGVLATGALPAAARAQESGQAPPPANGAPPETNGAPPETEVPAEQVDRVRRALNYKPIIDLNGDQLRFYVQIVGRPPMTFADYAKGSDLMHGPTRRGNPMSHQEFLKLVTPRELYSSGGITPAELLQFALTNWVGQTLVRRGLDEIKDAQTEKEKQDIRDRIDRELAILRSNEGR